MRWIRFAMLAAVASHGVVVAADFTLPELMRTLAEVPAAQARFSEVRQMSVLQAPLTVSGRLLYVRPDRIERHVLVPYDERTMISGDRVTIENRARNTKRTFALESAPGAYALAESLRATLAGDLGTLQRHYSVELQGGPADWALALAPRDPAVASLVSSVKIAGAHARILRFEVREANGDSSVMTISDDKP